MSSRGRPYLPLNNSVQVPHPDLPSTREAVLPRGRLPGPPNPTTGQAASQILSPRSQSSAATAHSPLGLNAGLERRPSVQGHHHNNRSHGGHQHGRNASFVNSPATSPLSPQIIPAEYVGMTLINHGALDPRLKESPASTGNGSSPLSGNTAGDNDLSEGNPAALLHKRAHGGKAKQGHSHQRTHSRQHHQEQKTVGEYALHHLFTSVCHHCPHSSCH